MEMPSGKPGEAGAILTPEEADQEFLDAYYESNLWLLRSGHMEVT